MCTQLDVPTRRSTDLHIRLKPVESRAWRAAAKRVDMTLSEWVRQLGNAAANCGDMSWIHLIGDVGAGPPPEIVAKIIAKKEK